MIVICITLTNDLSRFEPVLITPGYAPLSAVFVSSVILVVGLVGFIGLKCETGKVLVAYASFLMVILITETMVAYVFYAQFYQNFEHRSINNMDILMLDYDAENSTSRPLVDDLQKSVKCCGSNNSAVWLTLRDKFPVSCCEPHSVKLVSVVEPTTLSELDQFDDDDVLEDECSVSTNFGPCSLKIVRVIRKSTFVLSVTLVASGALQMLAAVFAMVVSRKFALMDTLKTRTVHEVALFGSERKRMLVK